MTITCLNCGESFSTRRRKTFCSDRCRYAYRDRRRFTPRGIVVTARCLDCQEPFTYTAKTKPKVRCESCREKRYGPGGSYRAPRRRLE